MRQGLLGLAAAAFAIIAARPAAAAEFTALYSAYWAGLSAGQIRLSLAEGGSGYRDSIEIRTVGLPGLLTHFRTSAQAAGRIVAGAPADPERYDALYDLRKRRGRHISMRFVRHDGAVVAVRGPGDSSHQKILAESFRRNVVDPLSALERIRQALAEARRAHRDRFRVPVYDGKRRFDIVGQVEPGGKPGVIEVALVLHPIAGFKKKPGNRDPEDAPRPVALKITDDARLMPLSITVTVFYLPLVVQFERLCATPDACKG
ncbi:MAG TPA: DUF3108 domain-containing protein [Stellaceae bacterium]|nr:DUF3108 domain-containing protein [Stellaceae bacterium]